MFEVLLNSRFSSLGFAVCGLLALAACSGPKGDGEANSTSSELGATCVASSLYAGNGFVGDLAAAVDPRFVHLGRRIAIPGALSASNDGFGVDFEPVDTVEGTAVVVDRNDDGNPCGLGCSPTTATLGGQGFFDSTLDAAAQDGAKALFDAMTRARETMTEGARVRRSARGLVTCTEYTTRPPSYACSFGNVQSVTPSEGVVSDVAICGLVPCRTTLLRTGMGVVADLAGAVAPRPEGSDFEIPNVVTGRVGMGIEMLTVVTALKVDEDALQARPRSPISATFGGRKTLDGQSTVGFRAAEALFNAMTRARETQDPSTGAVNRTSPGGRVLCTMRTGQGADFGSCHIDDIHRFVPIVGSGPVCSAS
jgi:hypothetical protein